MQNQDHVRVVADATFLIHLGQALTQSLDHMGPVLADLRSRLEQLWTGEAADLALLFGLVDAEAGKVHTAPVGALSLHNYFMSVRDRLQVLVPHCVQGQYLARKKLRLDDLRTRMPYAAFLAADPDPDTDIVAKLALLPKRESGNRLDDTDLRVLSIASKCSALLTEDNGMHSEGVADVLRSHDSLLRVVRYSSSACINDIEQLCRPTASQHGFIGRHDWGRVARRDIGRVYHIRVMDADDPSTRELRITYAHPTTDSPKHFVPLQVCPGRTCIALGTYPNRVKVVLSDAEYSDNKFYSVTYDVWRDQLRKARGVIEDARNFLLLDRTSLLREISNCLLSSGSNALSSLVNRLSQWMLSFREGNVIKSDAAERGLSLTNKIVLEELSRIHGLNELSGGTRRSRAEILSELRVRVPSDMQLLLDIYVHCRDWVSTHDWLDIPFDPTDANGHRHIKISLKGRIAEDAVCLVPDHEKACRRLRLYVLTETI